MTDEWKDRGSSAPITDGLLGTGGSRNWVEHKETGEVKEVYHNGDVGEGIRKGNFTDRKFGS